jgi:DNA-binding response OmpR family regulator
MSGGIDYIVKPFESKELILRVDAHLRNNSIPHSRNGTNHPTLRHSTDVHDHSKTG